MKIKYNSNHKKHSCKLVEESKKQVNKICIDKKLAIKIITDCRITSAHKVRTRLVFKHDINLTKEESVLRKIISSIEGQNIQTQYKV